MRFLLFLTIFIYNLSHADEIYSVLPQESSQLSLIDLKQDLNYLNQNVSDLRAENQNIKTLIEHPQQMAVISLEPMHEFLYIGSLAGVVFLLAFAGMIERDTPQPVAHRRTVVKKQISEPKKVVVPNAKADGEYDFMSSSEAIPSKFNLIEAYLEMKNYDLAKKELSNILRFGNIHQQSKAKLLMNQIPSV